MLMFLHRLSKPLFTPLVKLSSSLYRSEKLNNSLSEEETDELFENFDGSFSYDVWNFHLEEGIEEGEEV